MRRSEAAKKAKVEGSVLTILGGLALGDASADVTTISYARQGGMAAAGIDVAGGYVQTTTYAANTAGAGTMVDAADLFGHAITAASPRPRWRGMLSARLVLFEAPLSVDDGAPFRSNAPAVDDPIFHS